MMTIYPWRLTALVLLGAASPWVGGAGLRFFPNTPAWWATRPAWTIVLGATTAVLVAVLGRFESTPVAARGRALPLLQVGLTAALLALLADDGLNHLLSRVMRIAGRRRGGVTDQILRCPDKEARLRSPIRAAVPARRH